MSKKYFIIGLAVALAAGATWAGRTIYRAQKNLVTLDVYNTPLAEVVRQMEKQTGETILLGKDSDIKVTLAAKNLPLDEALDRLGVNWSKWHAVHESSRALDKLETALRDRASIEDAGWTNLVRQDLPRGPSWEGAPQGLGGQPGGAVTMTREIGGGAGVSVSGRKPVMIKIDSDDVKGGDVQAAIREKMKAAGMDDATIAKATSAMKEQTMDVDVQAGPGVPGGSNVVIRTGGPGGPQPRIRMVTRTRDGSGKVTEEVWSPENVVLEQKLHARLNGQTYDAASEPIAREVAEKAKADLTTLYLVRSAPGGFPMAGRMMRHIKAGELGDVLTNHIPGQPLPPPDIEGAVRRHEAENYLQLTPEQRVQRAREKQGAKSNP